MFLHFSQAFDNIFDLFFLQFGALESHVTSYLKPFVGRIVNCNSFEKRYHFAYFQLPTPPTASTRHSFLFSFFYYSCFPIVLSDRFPVFEIHLLVFSLCFFICFCHTECLFHFICIALACFLLMFFVDLCVFSFTL